MKRFLTDRSKDYMSKDIVSVSSSDELSQVIAILKQGFLVIVKKANQFYGLITKMDYINYLRKKLK